MFVGFFQAIGEESYLKIDYIGCVGIRLSGAAVKMETAIYVAYRSRQI